MCADWVPRVGAHFVHEGQAEVARHWMLGEGVCMDLCALPRRSIVSNTNDHTFINPSIKLLYLVYFN